MKMRRWIEHLITHSGAYDDFSDYIKSIEKTLNESILKAVNEDEMTKARSYAAELTAYKQIHKRVEASARELRSQAEYNQNNQ